MIPVIDSKKFDGSEDGLAIPVRRMSEGSFALSLDKPDTSDPPSPYKPGGVPRATPNKNKGRRLPAPPPMPTIHEPSQLGA